MKKVTIGIVFILCAASRVFAQWLPSGTGSNIYFNTGNVGIGITSPLYPLHIQKTIAGVMRTVVQNMDAGVTSYTIQEMDNDAGKGIQVGTTSSTLTTSGLLTANSAFIQNSGGSRLVFRSANAPIIFGIGGAGNVEAMRIDGNTGNVGIGIAPIYPLQIEKSLSGVLRLSTRNLDAGVTSAATVDVTNDVGIGIQLQALSSTYTTSGLIVAGTALLQNAGGSRLVIRSGTGPIIFGIGASGNTEAVRMDGSTGYVGIGTSTPLAKLDVNGNIYSNGKVYIGVADANTGTNMSTNLLAVNGSALFTKVTVQTPLWPDYVFSHNYKLTPLDSLEQFIQLNKHLPEVPTASDVEKNGIDLGDNQVLLLKKIEELTLIVIEQNKRIENLEAILKMTKEK